MDDDDIRAEARHLRESPHPYWVRFRQHLAEKGVDPQTSLIGSWSGDVDLVEGWLVTADGRVFWFEVRFGSRGDMKQMARDAVLERWEETTGQQDKWYPQDEVEEARRILRLARESRERDPMI